MVVGGENSRLRMIEVLFAVDRLNTNKITSWGGTYSPMSYSDSYSFVVEESRVKIETSLFNMNASIHTKIIYVGWAVYDDSGI